ncbi:glycosyltransferase [Streptomyces sp. NPDC007984]|uniref:glycosyltransferase family 2 protein n=1 Tax=Streptomyces sp. NPDC007984 TaxID=3364801 RepID=UPI0036F12ED0
MTLSIIIPTLNEEKYLGALLTSLLDQHMEAAYEVIIVDASPNDSTIQAANAYADSISIKVAKSPVADIGTQRNIGAYIAGHERLLFLDADVVLGDGVLHRCLRRLEPDELHIVSVRHRADHATIGVHATLVLIYFLILLARLTRLPVTNGDYLLTNKQTFQAAGGFKEGFLLGEDTDFGVRACRTGARHSIEWRTSVIASSRRLSVTPAWKLALTWATAYLRVIRGKGPTGTRPNDEQYPYGRWCNP